MPASPTIGDVYELVDVQRLAGQEVLNVYFYEIGEIFVDTRPTAAQVLAENWVDQILPTIRTLQVLSLNHEEIRVRNLFDGSDSFNLSISLDGAVNSPADTNFSAMGFELDGETHAVRKGAKRMAGITDDWDGGGVVVVPAGLTAAANVATKMGAAVQVGTLIPSDVFHPVLVKRIRSGVSGAYEYRLPATLPESISTRIINVLFHVLLTSQVSRKIGVGA